MMWYNYFATLLTMIKTSHMYYFKEGRAGIEVVCENDLASALQPLITGQLHSCQTGALLYLA